MTDKRVKVILCPPALQTVFFQETQFDQDLKGTDPNAYTRGQLMEFDSDSAAPSGAGTFVKKKRLAQAEKALEGHENKEEILKILRSE